MAYCSGDDQLAAGTTLGSYRIVRRIGVGGMGSVYEAQHEDLGKRVALKTPHLRDNQTAEGRARFVREGKAAARIRHPHVVDITDVGEVDNVAYLVMEYLEGETLAERIKREGPLSAESIADIVVPVTAALGEAHRQGVIHRDLKPDNIFLSQSVMGSPQPKLLDFGISKVLDDGTNPNLTSTHAFLGTPYYVSPEQLESTHSTDALSDQYSLGVVVYEAITATNPFSHHPSLMRIANAITNGDYQQLTEFRPAVDSTLGAVAARAMAVNPKDRFETIEHLGGALLPLSSVTTQTAWRQFFEELGTESSAPPPPRRARGAKSYLPWAIAASLAAAAGWLLWSLGPRAQQASDRDLASRQAVANHSPAPEQQQLSIRPFQERHRDELLQSSDPPRRTAAPTPPVDNKPRRPPPQALSAPAGNRARPPKKAVKTRATSTPSTAPPPAAAAAASKPPPAAAASKPAPRPKPLPPAPRSHPKTDNLDPWQ